MQTWVLQRARPVVSSYNQRLFDPLSAAAVAAFQVKLCLGLKAICIEAALSVA
jgi:hypothetical protein